MHQVQTLTTLVTSITADTREDMEATVASAVMAVVTNALAPPRPTVVGQFQTFGGPTRLPISGRPWLTLC